MVALLAWFKSTVDYHALASATFGYWGFLSSLRAWQATATRYFKFEFEFQKKNCSFSCESKDILIFLPVHNELVKTDG